MELFEELELLEKKKSVRQVPNAHASYLDKRGGNVK